MSIECKEIMVLPEKKLSETYLQINAVSVKRSAIDGSYYLDQNGERVNLSREMITMLYKEVCGG